MENLWIIVYNSSFSSLDLEPGTGAQIIESYTYGQLKDRPTLITANNSDVSIQNCHFKNFINENNSTILFGYNNSHVTIENSIFHQHKSSKGVLFLYNNSSLSISGSLFSQNIATSLGYSTISLRDGITTVVDSTVFRNNSALRGGAMYVEDWCQVTLANSSFSSNKATVGKILKILNNSIPQGTSGINHQYTSGTYRSPIGFHQTSIPNITFFT